MIDKLAKRSKLVRMRNWDMLVWKSGEIVDVNHFWVSTMVTSQNIMPNSLTIMTNSIIDYHVINHVLTISNINIPINNGDLLTPRALSSTSTLSLSLPRVSSKTLT